MGDNLLRITSKYFDAVNFSELNQSWLDEVFENDFTDVEESNMSVGILFADDPEQILLKICDVCMGWIKKNDFDHDTTNAGNVSTRPEEVLWTNLNEMDIDVKQILGIIFFLCSKALKNDSSVADKEIGLLGAKWYFCCLRIPGSSAYSVFRANLFRLCIDCFQIADCEEFLPTMVSALESLVPLITVCHLGSDLTVVDHVLGKLCELVGVEQDTKFLNFDSASLAIAERDRRRYSYSFVLASLAFQGLSAFIHSDLNGEKDYVYSVILSCLNRHILCVKAQKSTISAKFICVKDNCVSYLCYNLEKDAEVFSSLTLTALKRLCLTVYDKSEFRNAASDAIVCILFHLKIQDQVEFLQWLLLLVDSAETTNRAFALEIMGLFLCFTPLVTKEKLPETMKVYLSPIPIFYAILTRCDDISSNVRTKALSALSQHMQQMLNILMDQDFQNSLEEEFDEGIEVVNINGEHRNYWYKFSSFEAIVEEISNILHRRVEDSNGMSRKAALQALESIVSIDLVYLTDQNLKLFVLAARDPNSIVRKQTIHSLTKILEIHPFKAKIEECWLKCVFPLVQDPENSVQAKVLTVMEAHFLQNILSDISEDRDAAFSLLKKLAHGEYLSYQRYLQKAFTFWKAEKKLKPSFASKLENYFGNGKDEIVWFYLSIFGVYCKLPTNVCQLAVEEFQKHENWNNSSFMEYILKVLQNAFSDMPCEQLEVVEGILKEKLESFSAPVEIMPLMIEILHCIKKKDADNAHFADKMMEISMDNLIPFLSRKKSKKLPEEDLAVKSLIIIKEFCHIFPKKITQNLAVLLKSFVYTRNDEIATNASKVSSRLKAHAFASLGKISLQDQSLGIELLPVLAKELLTSEEDMLRNNAVLILIEMCRRYTSYADQYIPLVAKCFKDRRYIIRYQSITLVIGLLQEDYLKLQYNLLFCLLSTIVDKYESIQELSRYCLSTIVFEKKRYAFFDDFINAIFVFNYYFPPDNESLAKTVKDMERFSLPGEENREKRMQIYKFMLSHMEYSSRTLITQHIIHDLLTSAAESVFPLNDAVKCIVRDCFAILLSKEIRVFDLENLTGEMEEVDEERVQTADLEIRKLWLVQPILPVLISLKNCVLAGKSDLLSDIVLFLKEILSDFKNEIEELLAADKMLKMQVLFEMRNESNRQEKEAKDKKNKEARNAKKPTSGNHGAKSAEISAYLLQQRRDSLYPGDGDVSAAGSRDAPLSLVPQTPQSQTASRQSAVVHNDTDTNNDIHLPSTSGINVNSIMYSSTPRVLLKPLKLKSPNVSSINLRIDELDSD